VSVVLVSCLQITMLYKLVYLP